MGVNIPKLNNQNMKFDIGCKMTPQIIKAKVDLR